MKEFDIVTPRGAKEKGKFKLTLPRLEIKPRHTFLEYVFGGCEISLAIAVDFTQSNGDPKKRDSLHYLDMNGDKNEYLNAIKSVGNVLQYYDEDK